MAQPNAESPNVPPRVRLIRQFGDPARRFAGRIPALPGYGRWLAGAAVVVIALFVCLVVWGSQMEFPTTLSQSSVATSSGGETTLDRTVREVSGRAIDDAVDWLNKEAGWLFDSLSSAVDVALVRIEDALSWLPWPAVILGLALLSFAIGRWRLLGFTVLALLFIGFMDLWENTIDTVALMIVAVAVAVFIGLPVGVLASRSRVADNLLRPILDAMQTMPSFVYLLPGILFFGLGKPAGIFATIIYAVPPLIRLTNLGIRQVSPETIEAVRSFGASPRQILAKVQIPMALPTIMAGVNQTTLMALGMVTIASMVAAGGLGDNVLRALQKNQPGNGLIAGLAIVFLAIIFDRFTQAVSRGRHEIRRAG
ncbi:MAG: proline/glycine betaine ABC transporter permease [Chloroflexi bacterium]|nr:proline/glycine betaine ABC transporter permease [Chloroflexota bacterium]